jgi:hypothetical protein
MKTLGEIEIYPDPQKGFRLPLCAGRTMLLDRPLDLVYDKRFKREVQDVIRYVSWLSRDEKQYMPAEEVFQFVKDRLRTPQPKPQADPKALRPDKPRTTRLSGGAGGLGSLGKMKGCYAQVLTDFWSGRLNVADTLNTGIRLLALPLPYYLDDQEEAIDLVERYIDDLPDVSFSSRLSAGNRADVSRIVANTVRQVYEGNGGQPDPEASSEKLKATVAAWRKRGFDPTDKTTWRKASAAEPCNLAPEFFWQAEEVIKVGRLQRLLNVSLQVASDAGKFFLRLVKAHKGEIAVSFVRNLLERFGVKCGHNGKANKFLDLLRQWGWNRIPLLSPDERWLALVEDLGDVNANPQVRVRLLDARTGEVPASVRPRSPLTRGAGGLDVRLEFHPESRAVALCTGGWVELLAVPAGQSLLLQRMPEPPVPVTDTRAGVAQPLFFRGSPDATAFSADGKRLITALRASRQSQAFDLQTTFDFTVHAWDLALAPEPSVHLESAGSFFSAASDPAGKRLLWGGADGRVLATDPGGGLGWEHDPIDRTGRNSRLPPGTPSGLVGEGRVHVSLHPDGLELRDSTDGHRLRDLPAGRILAVAAHLRYLAVRETPPGGPAVVRILDTADDRWQQSFPWPAATRGHFSADGRYFAALAAHEVLVGSVDDGRTLLRLTATAGQTYREALFFPRGDRLLVERRQGNQTVLLAYETATGKAVAELANFLPTTFSFPGSIWLAPDGETVALAQGVTRGLRTEYSLFLWAVGSERPRRVEAVWTRPSTAGEETRPTAQLSVTFARGGKRLLVGGQQEDAQGRPHGVLALYDVTTGQALATARTEAWPASYARVGLRPAVGSGRNEAGTVVREVHPWGRFDLSEEAGTVLVDVVPAGNRGPCQLWELESGRSLAQPVGVPISISPDGKHVVFEEYPPLPAAGPEKPPRRLRTVLLDTKTGAVAQVLPEDAGRWDFAGDSGWAPDGSKLLAVGPTGVTVWDVARGAGVRLESGLGAHGFTTDSRRLLSLDWAGQHPLKVWDPATGELLKTIPLYDRNCVPAAGVPAR